MQLRAFSRATTLLGAAAAAALLAPAVAAVTIRVPADQPTIQAAVNAAALGDTISVSAGVYNEAVQIIGKPNLTLQGAGLGVTTIFAPGNGPALNIENSSGITVTGFRLSSEIVSGDSPTIAGMRILDCHPATVYKMLITRHSGNGIVLYQSDVIAWNNFLVNNGDDGFRMDGSFPGPCSLLAWNNTIADNLGGSGCGIWMASAAQTATVFDNIFYNNDYSIAISATTLDHDYNIVGGRGTHYYGPSSAAPNERDCDPLFADPVNTDYHITTGSCAQDTGTDIYATLPAASDDFENQPRPMGLAHDLGADELGGCFVALPAPPVDATICAGGAAVTLDASSANSPDCASGLAWDWTDGAGGSWSSSSIDVAPTSDTTYTVTISCMTDRSCATTASATVTVHEPPKLTVASASDIAPCTLGILVTWDAAQFNDPTRSGVYNIYRSETDCAAALAALPIVTGLTTTSWVDPGTQGGRTYVYVIQAEDARTSTVCPSGPDHGGATTEACTASATESEDAIPPAGVFAALRARHDGDVVTMLWPTARALAAGEHFHLKQALDLPTSPFLRVNPEGDLTRSDTRTDMRSWIQFFDLRVANGCEIESDPEYPPGYD